MARTASDPTPDAHRLFFALWPDEGLRGSLHAAVDTVAGFAGRGRPVSPSKYHLTLHFLGGWPELPHAVADGARRAADGVQAGAFHLVVDHAGGFARSRVGWLAPTGNSGLDALWSALGHRLDEENMPCRRAETFSPHVTVLRAVRGRLAEAPIAPLSWPVEDFVLVHSHAGRYDVIRRWPLAQA